MNMAPCSSFHKVSEGRWKREQFVLPWKAVLDKENADWLHVPMRVPLLMQNDAGMAWDMCLTSLLEEESDLKWLLCFSKVGSYFPFQVFDFIMSTVYSFCASLYYLNAYSLFSFGAAASKKSGNGFWLFWTTGYYVFWGTLIRRIKNSILFYHDLLIFFFFNISFLFPWEWACLLVLRTYYWLLCSEITVVST